MFGTIRKHQAWLWGIIVTLTIFSFVLFWGNPANRASNTQGGSGGNFGVIYGEPITRDEFVHAQNEMLLQYFFMTGLRSWYNEDEARKANFDLLQRTYARLLLLRKQEQLGIHISSDLAGRAATQMLHNYERGGSLTPEVFQKNVLDQ